MEPARTTVVKAFSIVFSLVLPFAMLPGVAQNQECAQRSEQLLLQLTEEASSSIEAMIEQQRQTLLKQGCDPQATGYDVKAEGLKLDQQLDFKPEGKGGFRLDKLIRIEY
ncbi:MAG: hypothetical protein HQ527_04375 [Cyanobacteria bacterium]|nr:hypothetical protein [Cyanobacteria bacterium bin.51]